MIILNKKEQKALLELAEFKKFSRFNDILHTALIMVGVLVLILLPYSYAFKRLELTIMPGSFLIIFGIVLFLRVIFTEIFYGIIIKLMGKNYFLNTPELFRKISMDQKISIWIGISIMILLGVYYWIRGYLWASGFTIVMILITLWAMRKSIKNNKVVVGGEIYKEVLRRIIQSCGAQSAQKDKLIPDIEELKAKGFTDEDLYDLGLTNEVILSKEENFTLKIAKILKKCSFLAYLVFISAIFIGMLECIFIINLSLEKFAMGLWVVMLLLFYIVIRYSWDSVFMLYGIIEKLRTNSSA